MKLDDIEIRQPERNALQGFESAFREDFGDIDGHFEMHDADLVFSASYRDKPVAIRGQRTPVGTWDYTINGNRASLPGDFHSRDLAERQQLLVEEIARWQN
jgi:hypothetical protein